MGLKTVFILTVATLRMVFPGLPAQNAPGGHASSLPYTRSLTAGLWSDKTAGQNARAVLSLPPGLKVGASALMEIDRTSPEEVRKAAAELNEQSLRCNVYWGSSEKIAEGQPKVVEPGKPGASEISASLPEASFAYWPGTAFAGLTQDARAVGTYKLTTNYAGSTSVLVDPRQEFLDPVTLVGVANRFDLSKPVTVQWNAVPNAAAYLVTAGGGDDKTSVSWTSSEKPELSAGLEEKALTRAEVEKYVAEKVLLPSTATSCIIPAGVFLNSTGAMLTVTAIGADRIQETPEMISNVIVRSSTTVPLKGAYEPPDKPESAESKK